MRYQMQLAPEGKNTACRSCRFVFRSGMESSLHLYGTGPIVAVRAASFDCAADNNVDITPGMFLSWDADQGSADLRVVSQPGTLLGIDARISGDPGWVSLNFGIGNAQLSAGTKLGIVASIGGTASTMIHATWRSSIGEEWRDIDFPDAIGGAGKPATCVALADVHMGAYATRPEAHSLLILHLPRQDFRLDLRDLLIFGLSGDDAASAPEPTLGAFAV
jgi:hypothetical protein